MATSLPLSESSAMSSSVRGRPRLPLPTHAAASAAQAKPRVLRYSSTRRPPSHGLTMLPKNKSRLCFLPHCAADQTCQPSPDEDPAAAWFRAYREELDNYERKLGAAFRAVEGCSSQHAMVAELEITLFREEDDKRISYMREICSNRCILYTEGRGLALMLCSMVGIAIQASALVAANARLSVDAIRGVSFLTVEQIIGTYVSTFLKIAADACHRKIDRTSIISFLDALRGLAAISHILIQDALDAMNNIEGCSKNFSTVFDVDALSHDLHFKMKELEINFTAASHKEAYELLWSTLSDATDHVSLFVIQMTNLRKRVVTHIQKHIQGKVGNTIGKEDATDKEHINDMECTNDEEHDAS